MALGMSRKGRLLHKAELHRADVCEAGQRAAEGKE